MWVDRFEGGQEEVCEKHGTVMSAPAFCNGLDCPRYTLVKKCKVRSQCDWFKCSLFLFLFFFSCVFHLCVGGVRARFGEGGGESLKEGHFGKCVCFGFLCISDISVSYVANTKGWKAQLFVCFFFSAYVLVCMNICIVCGGMLAQKCALYCFYFHFFCLFEMFASFFMVYGHLRLTLFFCMCVICLLLQCSHSALVICIVHGPVYILQFRNGCLC